MTDQTNKGRDRDGRGRPPAYGEKLSAIRATVTPEMREKIREFGFGNISLGVRRLAADAFDLDLSEEDVETVFNNLTDR